MKYKIELAVIVIGLLGFRFALATSGACSSHQGVNCAAGHQLDGTVYCNDGWTDSMVQYDFMAMCQSNASDLLLKQLLYDGKIVWAEYTGLPGPSVVRYVCPSNSTTFFLSGENKCECDNGYYASKGFPTDYAVIYGTSCVREDPPLPASYPTYMGIFKAQNQFYGRTVSNQLCNANFINSQLINGECNCTTGYRWIDDVYLKALMCVSRDDMVPPPLPTPTLAPTEIPQPFPSYGASAIPNGAGVSVNDADIFRASNDYKVYIAKYVNGKMFKRWFVGPQMFGFYKHLGFAKVKVVDPSIAAQFTESKLIRKDGNQEIYFVGNATAGQSADKELVNPSAFQAAGFDQDGIFVINSAESNWYSMGANFGSASAQ
jgi:hypothetical protein